jgi:inward rectifier potassium channel
MERKKQRNQPTRLLTREGELNVHKDRFKSQIVYNHIIAASWQRLLLYALLAYIFINILFSLMFYCSGGISCLKNVKDYPHAFAEILEIFFFSTQTFSTVGYGHVYPDCLGSNIIASLESFTGLIFFSVVTGLFYTKFTQPRVEIKLSDVAIFDVFKEGHALKFMLANVYENKIVDVEVTLDLIKLQWIDGRYKKSFYQLYLFRKRIPFLSVPWTVVHPIDENSPLKGLTKEDFENQQIEFFVQVKFFDENHHKLVFKEFSYFGKEEVRWGHKFVNIQRYTETGALKLNMKRFGKTIALEDFPNVV